LNYTIRKLLPNLGELLGMQFVEVIPGAKSYPMLVSAYLASSKVTEREAELSVLLVRDMTGFTPSPLGYLVMDLIERDGKPRQLHCGSFPRVRACTPLLEFAVL
jgi:hypothetical protein